MADLHGGRINENSAAAEKKDVTCLEDEINLMDYFTVLWKRKIFIFLATVLPTLIVGITLFCLPKDYSISYLYKKGLDEKSFRVLEDTFYSTENIEKLAGNLQKKGLEQYAQKLTQAKTLDALKEAVSFDISPSYFEIIKPAGAKNVEELQKMQEIMGTLLVMCVKGKANENLRESASVCRENFEQSIPLYSEREGLNDKIISLKGKIAAIEEGRYLLDLRLERIRALQTQAIRPAMLSCSLITPGTTAPTCLYLTRYRPRKHRSSIWKSK
jgi:hypothetical protein